MKEATKESITKWGINIAAVALGGITLATSISVMKEVAQENAQRDELTQINRVVINEDKSATVFRGDNSFKKMSIQEEAEGAVLYASNDKSIEFFIMETPTAGELSRARYNGIATNMKFERSLNGKQIYLSTGESFEYHPPQTMFETRPNVSKSVLVGVGKSTLDEVREIMTKEYGLCIDNTKYEVGWQSPAKANKGK